MASSRVEEAFFVEVLDSLSRKKCDSDQASGRFLRETGTSVPPGSNFRPGFP